MNSRLLRDGFNTGFDFRLIIALLILTQFVYPDVMKYWKIFSLPFQLYFALTTVITTNFLDQERQYLAGNRSAPESASFLEPETISPGKFNCSTYIVYKCARITACRRGWERATENLKSAYSLCRGGLDQKFP